MKYHKIQSVFKRDESSRFTDEFSKPEFGYLANLDWVGTEKVDGTNVRVSFEGIKGKSDEAQLHPKLITTLEPILLKLHASDLPLDTILYGEGHGAKIQNGGHYIPNGMDFVLFDVMISGNFQPQTTVDVIALQLGIRSCPIVGIQSLTKWIEEISSGEKYRTSFLYPNGGRNEGVVLRPLYELQDRSGNRIITKLKFKDFNKK